MARCISVIDMENVALSDLAGDKLEFLRKSVAAANAHYPERSFMILIINVPYWFSIVWGIVKPYIHERTLKRMRVLNKSQAFEGSNIFGSQQLKFVLGLQEVIDVENIPTFYGGKLTYGDDNDSCRYFLRFFDSSNLIFPRFLSPEAIEMDEFVRRLNASSITNES